MSEKEYASIEDFHSDDERRRLSPEADFGIWWCESEEKPLPQWRVSYVRATGEVYALEMGDKEQVKLLGTYPIDEGPIYFKSLHWLLDGWARLQQKPLRWAVERLDNATTERLSGGESRPNDS